jgi:hypothetical protein
MRHVEGQPPFQGFMYHLYGGHGKFASESVGLREQCTGGQTRAVGSKPQLLNGCCVYGNFMRQTLRLIWNS